MSANGLTSQAQLRYKYFQAPDAMAQVIHQELYAAWERNLSLLEPAALFTTQPSESGDILLNDSLLVAGGGASVFSESRIEATGNRCRRCLQESAVML